MGEVIGGNVVAIWETSREKSLGLFEQVPAGRRADLGPLPGEPKAGDKVVLVQGLMSQ